MPQGQQKNLYVVIAFMKETKVLLFIELQIGDDGEVIA